MLHFNTEFNCKQQQLVQQQLQQLEYFRNVNLSDRHTDEEQGVGIEGRKGMQMQCLINDNNILPTLSEKTF